MRSRLSNSIPASLPRRLAALFYDGLLILALWMFIEFLVVAFNHGQAMTDAQRPFVQTIVFVAIFSFFAGFWMHGGKTLGMQAWQIKLVTQDGKPLRLMQCLLRFFVAILSIGLAGFGYWWMLWDKDKLTWHDRYSMTKIICTKKPKTDAKK
jgi:uncharacterized RDD family membrane protein YckC